MCKNVQTQVLSRTRPEIVTEQEELAVKPNRAAVKESKKSEAHLHQAPMKTFVETCWRGPC